MNSQQKESQAAIDSKDKQISELRKALQESVESKRNEYEKKVCECSQTSVFVMLLVTYLAL